MFHLRNYDCRSIVVIGHIPSPYTTAANAAWGFVHIKKLSGSSTGSVGIAPFNGVPWSTSSWSIKNRDPTISILLLVSLSLYQSQLHEFMYGYVEKSTAY